MNIIAVYMNIPFVSFTQSLYIFKFYIKTFIIEIILIREYDQ